MNSIKGLLFAWDVVMRMAGGKVFVCIVHWD